MCNKALISGYEPDDSILEREIQLIRQAFLEAILRRDFDSFRGLYIEDIDAPIDADYNTLLMLACQRSDLEMIEFLLQKGAKIDYQNIDGGTALMWACDCGNFDAVKLLVQKGADFEIENSDGDKAITMASANGYSAIIEFLIEQGAEERLAKYGDISAMLRQ